MLTLNLKANEFFDSEKNEFHYSKDKIVELEHSLLTASEWESKFHKSLFYTMEQGLSSSETIEYIKIMSNNELTNEDIYAISAEDMERIKAYMEDPMTATTFMELKKKSDINAGRRVEIITTELVYYWMIELGIPFECEKWHLNRLMTLIRVCSVKNSSGGKGSKMNRKETMAFNRALMASRRGKMGGL